VRSSDVAANRMVLIMAEHEVTYGAAIDFADAAFVKQILALNSHY